MHLGVGLNFLKYPQQGDKIMTTSDKIKAFQNLERGWHFGEGIGASPASAKSALAIQAFADAAGFQSDAFPGLDGSMVVVLYQENRSHEFTLTAEGAVEYCCEEHPN